MFLHCSSQNMCTFEGELEKLLGEFHIKMKGKRYVSIDFGGGGEGMFKPGY